MASIGSQVDSLFGIHRFELSEVRNLLLPEVEQILKECCCQASCIILDRFKGGLELRINLAEGWGIFGSRVVASGARPPVDSNLTERLLELPGVNRVVYWDSAGRYIQEDRSAYQSEGLTDYSIPLMISTVVRKSSEANQEQFREEFSLLRKALQEAGAPDGEDLGVSMRRLSQAQIKQFYEMFRKMPS